MDGAIKGLEGWVKCFEKAKLCGVVRGLGLAEVGAVKGNTALLKEAYKHGQSGVIMMNVHDAVDLLKAIKRIGIEVWLDGGWGVDALIGRQTRPHNGIDIFIEKKRIRQRLLNF